MKRILVSGVSGVGKTSVGRYLRELGYESTDIENIGGMFKMVHKGTNEVFDDYDNAKPEHIKNAEWVCDVNRLNLLLESQKSDLSFYTGIASNMDDIIPFFDKVFVLKPDSETLNRRLKNREGTDDIGNNQEGRDVVLGWKDWWESEMEKKNAILVDANGTLEEIGKEILLKVRVK